MEKPAPIEAWRWRIVWLLFLATLINYTDRLALVSTQRAVLEEFVGTGDDKRQERDKVYGSINFAFGMSFGLFQILAGFLIDRFSLRLLYLGAIVVWSAAGVATGFAPTGAIVFLMSCRVILGFGEAFNWPCAVATIRRVIPRESRSLANGIFHSGASIGAVATPLLALSMVGEDGSGWRNLFILVGSVGMLWAVLWLYFTAGERGRAIDALALPEGEKASETSKPFIAVLGLRLFWITLLTGVCVNVCWHVYYTWFPRFLTENLHQTKRHEQWIMAGFFICADFGSMLSGYTIRRLTRRGCSVERARKMAMILLAAICLLSIPAVQIDNVTVRFTLFYLVAVGAMGGYAVFFSLAQDIIGRHTAQILGVCGAVSWVVIASISGFVSTRIGPALGGDVLLTYGMLFMGIGCAPALAAVVGWFWPEPARDVHSNKVG